MRSDAVLIAWPLFFEQGSRWFGLKKGDQPWQQ